MNFRSLIALLKVLLCSVTLVGCQNLPEHTASTPNAKASAPAASAPHPIEARDKPQRPAVTRTIDDTPEAPADLWERLRRDLQWAELDNPAVRTAREQFLDQPTYLDVIAARSELYLYYIVEEVTARGMPVDIALLPLVESTMNPFARSPEHALGLWQIMPATGRHLGLTSNWWYDGRQDLRDSTAAALDYLEELHADFDGDWLLALAAYNSGKGRVSRAIRYNDKRGRPTDFWSLRLPRETRSYVPRLVALANIIGKPERFAATLPPVPNAPAFTVVDTGGQLELARAAELAGLDEATVRALNPGHLRWATAPDQAPELLLPPDTVAQFEEGVASLNDKDRVRWQHYRIRRGDTLGRIARRFDTEVGMLREVNNLRGSFIRAGDDLLIPRGSSWSDSLALKGGKAPVSRDYRVRPGDSLYRIAGRFKVSIADIVAWNALDPGAFIYPGQQLTLYVNDG